MKKIIFILVALVSNFSYSQTPTMPFGAKVADSSKWTATGANITNKNTGNVGIGTANPLASLHVANGGGLFTGASTFITGTTGVNIGTAASQPTIGFRNNAGALDSKNWDFYASTTKLFGRAINDANTIESKWIEVTRVGGAINNVAFPTGNVGIGTTTPVSSLEVNGSVGRAITVIAANLTLTIAHNTVIIPSGSAFTITLPTAASSTRRVYTIVNKSATVKTIGSYNNLLGATVTTMAANTSIQLQSDGTIWHQIR